MQTFLAQHPLVEIDLEEQVSTASVRAISEGTADIGIFDAGTPSGDLITLPYQKDRLVVVTPRGHPLARRSGSGRGCRDGCDRRRTRGQRGRSSGPWSAPDAPASARFPWDPASTYLRRPPFVAFVPPGPQGYGTGSSRDWAAKGAQMLGAKAVLAASFERIHRSNLIGMGVLPLRLPEGWVASTLRIAPGDTIEIDFDPAALAPRYSQELVNHNTKRSNNRGCFGGRLQRDTFARERSR